MFGRIVKKIVGLENKRYLSSLQKRVATISEMEKELEDLTHEQILEKVATLKTRAKNEESLDNLLEEAFAIVREASKRSLNMRPYDVQILGAIILHEGKIAEMKTGEGKTLVSTMAVFLNALAGKGVHVITVNDYLVSRDATWMGKLYNYLGLSVGCITSDMNDAERKAAYACDVTYGTNNEFGFDYLRDNMKYRQSDLVQKPYNFAIVDEVDSILIDEARVPLVISGPAEDHSAIYTQMNELVKKLNESDFDIDKKSRAIQFSETGNEHLEEILKEASLLKSDSLYDTENIRLVHYANQAAMANFVFQENTDYLVSGDDILLVDHFTGRPLAGRRLSNGLHQALEAKHGLPIGQESQTLASITYQNLFRLYPKLAGMTGTAMTEAAEFEEIYDLTVVEVPTHLPMIRKDFEDLIFLSEKEKQTALIEKIKELNANKQPILIGTTSVEKSEELSRLLIKERIKHNVLNAKQHEKEADIILNSGVPGSVTIATNMAGRGTDIQLGGNLEYMLSNAKDEDKEKVRQKHKENKEVAIEAGGLAVISTERHESRRIDNQLRGRSGRQGDPGMSIFYLSMQDDLMRRFGSEKLDAMLRKFGLEDGEAIEHPWVSKAIERAQKNVEGYNFEIRKQALRYDDVLNDQRKIIYGQRKEIMAKEAIDEMLDSSREDLIMDIIEQYIPTGSQNNAWDIESLTNKVLETFNVNLPIKDWAEQENISEELLIDRIEEAAKKKLADKKEKYGEPFDEVRSHVILQVIDRLWQEHLLTLDHLRQSIGLRAYGQRNPLDEYKREAFDLFEILLSDIARHIHQTLSFIEIDFSNDEESEQKQEMDLPKNFDDKDPSTWKNNISRNAPCPCNSGKKFKHCHGKVS